MKFMTAAATIIAVATIVPAVVHARISGVDDSNSSRNLGRGSSTRALAKQHIYHVAIKIRDLKKENVSTSLHIICSSAISRGKLGPSHRCQFPTYSLNMPQANYTNHLR